MAELIYTHGTASFMMFHIGEVPGYDNEPPAPGAAPRGNQSNRKMIQANLYTLCLNALMSTNEEDEACDSA